LDHGRRRNLKKRSKGRTKRSARAQRERKKALVKRSKAHVKYTIIERKKTAHVRVRGRFKTTRRKLSAVKAREATAGERSLTNLETLADNLPDITFVKNRDHRYVLVNKPFCAFLGKRKDQVLGKTAHDLYPKDVADISEEFDKQVFELGVTVDSQERERPDAQGVARILQTKKAPLKDTEGNVTNLIGISRDITERKQMEEKLRESEDLYHRLTETSPDSVVVHVDGKIVAVNSTGARLLGATDPKELIGRSAWDFLHPDYQELVKERLRQTTECGVQAPFVDQKLVRLDGSVVDVEVASAPLTYQGKQAVQVVARDITERKKMEETLRRSEEMFRRVFRSNPLPGTITLPEGPIMDVNDAWVRMSGYSREEAVGRSSIELGMLPDPEERGRIVNDLLKKRRLSNVEITRRTKSGELRHLLNTLELVELGGQTCVLNMQVDITDRKKMEEALWESEGNLQSFIDAVQSNAYVIDTEGTILLANQWVAKRFGKPHDQLIGSCIYDLISPGVVEHRRTQTDKVIRSGRPVMFESTRGEEYFDYRLFPIFGPDGKVTKIAVLGTDVTERKRMQEELRRHTEHLEELVEERTGELKRSEEKFRQMYDASLNAMYTTTLDGKIVDMNPAGVSMFGYDSLDELKKSSAESLYANSDERKKTIELVSKGPIRNLEVQYKKKDGKIFDALTNAYPIKDNEGRIIGFQGAIIDITERRELDRTKDQLTHTLVQDAIRRKELEEMRNQFISAVTHELRTPLVSIKGYLDLALSRSVSEEVHSDLLVVNRNTERLLGLTNDLLDIQRMQAGRLQLNLQPLDLREVIDSSITDVQPLIQEKKVSLRLEVPEGKLPIQGDQVKLSQVIVNLLSNAIKFSPDGGEVTLRAEDTEDMIRVQVSDRGIGIKREDLERVFEPFAAISKPTYIKGTGLGLSIAKGLVEAHGGKIWAESEGKGKGAMFTFTLPKRKEVI
jgi:PAS domain S-box-containing protein